MTSPFVLAFKKGLISILWRVAFGFSTSFLLLLVNNLYLLHLPVWLVALIGIVAGELTKQINTWENTKLQAAAQN